MLRLYDYYRSSASFRVRIALHLKKLQYEEMPVHLMKNEQHAKDFKTLNPSALVPVLQDGDKMISQSLAIIDYLEDLHPTPSLFPVDSYQKALARSFALMITADLHPLNNLRVLNYLTQELELSDAAKNQWYQHWTETGLSALEKNLSASKHTGDYCFGNQLTIADICLVPQLFNARRFNCNLEAYPTLVRIDAHCQKQPAIQSAWPREETTA